MVGGREEGVYPRGGGGGGGKAPSPKPNARASQTAAAALGPRCASVVNSLGAPQALQAPKFELTNSGASRGRSGEPLSPSGSPCLSHATDIWPWGPVVSTSDLRDFAPPTRRARRTSTRGTFIAQVSAGHRMLPDAQGGLWGTAPPPGDAPAQGWRMRPLQPVHADAHEPRVHAAAGRQQLSMVGRPCQHQACHNADDWRSAHTARDRGARF